MLFICFACCLNVFLKSALKIRDSCKVHIPQICTQVFSYLVTFHYCKLVHFLSPPMRKGFKNHPFFIFRLFICCEAVIHLHPLCCVKAEVLALDEGAYGAGELSVSVGRRALMRRLCDAEGYNIREFKLIITI